MTRATARPANSSTRWRERFSAERDALDPGEQNAHAELDRIYGRATYIGGRPINDSSHFGSTLINDYGRAYEGGFNALTGFSARAEDVRLSLKVRGEYQHAPGRAAYPLSVRQTIAEMDTALQVPATPVLPATPVDTTNEFRLIDANLSLHVLNHEISVGKSEDWWGPGEGGCDGLEHQRRAHLCLTHQSRRAAGDSAALQAAGAIPL